MLDWLRKLVAGSGARRGVPARPVFIRGKYDAAQTNDDNRRHWANADGYSADASASPDVRRTIRNRARYEVHNNCYARGIVDTIANYVIGRGPSAQVVSDDTPWNDFIESEFPRWCREVNLAAKLRTMRVAQSCDGEAFAIFSTNPRLRSPVKLDIRLVEADQVTTPDLSILNPLTVDGIAFDAAGNPLEYHVLQRHPGDVGPAWSFLNYDRVPADQVVHLFRQLRPGQSRGLPEIMPALPLFAELRRYTLAVLAAAETAADFAGFLCTNAPPDDETAAGTPFETVEIERRMLTVAPDGYEPKQLKAEQPTTTYPDYKNALINEIARALHVPFNIASGNSSSYNYASGRLDHQAFFRWLAVDQEHIELVVLARVFEHWLREARLAYPNFPKEPETWELQWFWPGHEHVDPQKEAAAQDVRLANGTTTYADEYARAGRDWEVAFRQRARERQLAEELGIPLAGATPKAEPAASTDQNDGEDQPDDRAEQSAADDLVRMVRPLRANGVH